MGGREAAESGGPARFAGTIPTMADIDYQSSDDRKYERGPILRKLFPFRILARQIRAR
jgi:hypothetical protein